MTSGCVLDASAGLALLAASQMTAASRTFAAALPPAFLAPCVFSIEVRHGILRLERRGLLARGYVDAQLSDLERTIEMAPAPDPAELVRLMAFARQENLGIYDALYIDLALERGAPLASRDSVMLAAAERRSVATIDLR